VIETPRPTDATNITAKAAHCCNASIMRMRRAVARNSRVVTVVSISDNGPPDRHTIKT
jgi:hypothetical protein